MEQISQYFSLTKKTLTFHFPLDAVLTFYICPASSMLFSHILIRYTQSSSNHASEFGPIDIDDDSKCTYIWTNAQLYTNFQ